MVNPSRYDELGGIDPCFDIIFISVSIMTIDHILEE